VQVPAQALILKLELASKAVTGQQLKQISKSQERKKSFMLMMLVNSLRFRETPQQVKLKKMNS
jgi:hypothetical protein